MCDSVCHGAAKSAGGPATFWHLLVAIFCLAVVLAVTPTRQATAQAVDQPPDPVICEAGNCRVPLDRLANADTHPIRRGLHIIDADHARWDQYRRAIRRYSDVRACLLREERRSDSPNLLAFDWRGIGERREPSDVCLFRVAASLNTIEAVENWLRLQGFIRITRFDLPRLTERDDIIQPTMFVSGQWRDERYYEVYPSLLYSLFDIALSRNFAVQIQFTEAGEVYSASSSSSGIFN